MAFDPTTAIEAELEVPSRTSYGTPSKLLDNLERVESGGNPLAVNKDSGAMGAYQFMPSTVEMLKKQGIEFNPFDKQQSREAADQYISKLAERHGGDYEKAMADYGGFITKDPTEYVGKVMKGVTKEPSFDPTTAKEFDPSSAKPVEEAKGATIWEKVKEATWLSPTAQGARGAVTAPVGALQEVKKGITELFNPTWQKKYKEEHGTALSKKELETAYDVALNWMPVTEFVGSLKRMKDMVPPTKEVLPVKPVTAEEVIRTADTTERLMKADSSGSLIVDTQKFVNDQLGIKPAKEAEKTIKQKRAEVKAAFAEDKDYADYLRFAADERIQLREQWAKTESWAEHTKAVDKLEKELAENKAH